MGESPPPDRPRYPRRSLPALRRPTAPTPARADPAHGHLSTPLSSPSRRGPRRSGQVTYGLSLARPPSASPSRVCDSRQCRTSHGQRRAHTRRAKRLLRMVVRCRWRRRRSPDKARCWSKSVRKSPEAEEQVASHGLDAIPVTEARVHPGLCTVSPRAANHQGNPRTAHIPSARARERPDAALRGTACEQNTKGGLAWTRV